MPATSQIPASFKPSNHYHPVCPVHAQMLPTFSYKPSCHHYRLPTAHSKPDNPSMQYQALPTFYFCFFLLKPDNPSLQIQLLPPKSAHSLLQTQPEPLPEWPETPLLCEGQRKDLSHCWGWERDAAAFIFLFSWHHLWAGSSKEVFKIRMPLPRLCFYRWAVLSSKKLWNMSTGIAPLLTLISYTQNPMGWVHATGN